MMNSHSDTIKQLLTMQEIAVFYGFKVHRGNFIPCPFHSEKTASCRLYEHSFYCFGCGAGGDVIKFVQQLFNLTFPQALARLNADFGLGLLIEKPDRKAVDKYKQACKALEAKKKALWEEMNKLTALHRRYWWDLRELRPPDNRFFEALTNIENVRYKIEVMEEEWNNLKISSPNSQKKIS